MCDLVTDEKPTVWSRVCGITAPDSPHGIEVYLVRDGGEEPSKVTTALDITTPGQIFRFFLSEAEARTAACAILATLSDHTEYEA